MLCEYTLFYHIILYPHHNPYTLVFQVALHVPQTQIGAFGVRRGRECGASQGDQAS